ncbi:MAG: acetate--CoA ligase [Thermoflexus sp.]|jgi:acetyl-CoA synthetase|uniref:acetate--CoA ligase n=1 Tax=Thermoflexus sp. TaxID=1969742 RepID=UPI0026341984|nr:acetate--CoA ligase [Thermoflexus sp.]MDT7885095.1 acetate--CoA ligase [Thermoflexus sp.]MDT7949036.1 acetate--CoA ligase [Thermoflexus sp.]
MAVKEVVADIRHLSGEVYYPSPEVLERAYIKNYEEVYSRAMQDLEAFWAERAEELEWFRKWDRVLDDSNKPFYKWFVGGKINICYNAVDRHMKTWRKNKVALYWEAENGERRVLSYYDLYREVNRFANVLKALGVRKGDRVTIYMPRIPELPIAMLACARIGAIHSVVFAGFSVEALHTRIEDSKSRLVITADGGYLNGRIVETKRTVDEAVRRAPSVEHVLVVRRTRHEVPMEPGRDYFYDELARLPFAQGECPVEETDAEDPLYILYTSGTTGAPKGQVHVHGGYAVYIYTTMKWVFDIKDEDIWWCTADPGWVTGHSYIVYAPLMLGATSVMYEGAPTYPYPDRWWSIVEKYGVTVLYTTPTAIRGLMRFGDEWPNRRNLSSLRLLGTVGEPINPEAWRWYYRVIGKGRCPIMDTWWMTETGGFMITPMPCVPLKPGSATLPFPGIRAEVVDENGNPCPPGVEGYLVIQNPWPGMSRTLYGDPDRYVKTYWSKYPGWFFTGDSARRDEDGYFYIIGRVDDVLKVSGYRLGTAEIESALVAHPAVAEAAAIGLPHEVKGEGIHCYVILKAGYTPSEALAEELRQHVAQLIGPIARPEAIHFVDKLPKTRSGKIMRRVLRARALGLPEGDLSTLEE